MISHIALVRTRGSRKKLHLQGAHRPMRAKRRPFGRLKLAVDLICGLLMSGPHDVKNGNHFTFPFSFDHEGKINIIEDNDARLS
jgi:hypothetical protein